VTISDIRIEVNVWILLKLIIRKWVWIYFLVGDD